MLREQLKRILREAAGLDAGADFSLDAPPKPEYGDYATNLPILLAKKKEKNPLAVAEELAKNIRHELIEGISVVPPGFLNIHLADSARQAAINEVLEKKEFFGDGDKKSEKIQVEFISANPTGPLTLANGRGGFYGDVLSRVLESQGFEVEREYYINDAGNQVRMLGLSVLAAGGLTPGSEDYYHGEHIASWAEAHHEALDARKDDPETLGRMVAADFLAEFIKPAVEQKMKIHFQRWTSERADIREKGYVDRALALFKERGLVVESDGAVWLTTTSFGDDKDRVLVTSDGLPTYFLVDAGHYVEAKERGFAKINILGADHHGYVSRIQAIAKIIGLSKSEVIVMQMVRLVEEGKETRMSKRKGVFVTIDDLIHEVGLDAVRYFFLEKNPETHIDFDIELAKKQSKENPVYYIQYAHARLCSIFKKGAVVPAQFEISALNSDSEKALIRKLIAFPEVLEDIAADYRVSRLVHYAYELAHAFHLFYEKNRILDAEGEVKDARMALAAAAQIVLKKTLDILGMEAPNEM